MHLLGSGVVRLRLLLRLQIEQPLECLVTDVTGEADVGDP